MCEKNPTVRHHLRVYILANPLKQPRTFAKSPSSLETYILAHYLQSSSGAAGEEGELACHPSYAAALGREEELACRPSCAAAQEPEEAGHHERRGRSRELAPGGPLRKISVSSY